MSTSKELPTDSEYSVGILFHLNLRKFKDINLLPPENIREILFQIIHQENFLKIISYAYYLNAIAFTAQNVFDFWHI